MPRPCLWTWLIPELPLDFAPSAAEQKVFHCQPCPLQTPRPPLPQPEGPGSTLWLPKAASPGMNPAGSKELPKA